MHLIDIDASVTSAFRAHNGLGGIPGPAAGHPDFPDMLPLWREAGVTLVRSYDWVSRLDTRDNPDSLFPDWSADPSDPSSYNFAATDDWVSAVHSIDAEVLFNFSSSIPGNKLPAADVAKYATVVEHIVRHYAQGWAGGPEKPVRMYEFGDQPDFGPLHFAGTAEQFYEMYAAFVRAVKRVDPNLQAGGPSLAFPLNPDAPYREGLLNYLREHAIPLDFFSFLWFVDKSRDPMDFGYVARELRALLDRSGFVSTKLMLSYWNYLGIPSNDAPVRERAAFHATAAMCLQDTVIDHALFFRGDSGKDPHYNFNDPSAIVGPEGQPDERTGTFAMVGKAMSGERLATSVSGDAACACMASIEDQTIRILLSNFVPPREAVELRESDEFTFRIPIGAERIELSFRLPPQRRDMPLPGAQETSLTVRNLQWPDGPIAMTTWSNADGETKVEDTIALAGRQLSFSINLPEQGVAMVELCPCAA